MGESKGRERILVAAERLIAERGVDVPFRDIAAGAGQRNNSAVHYHFGSREGLVDAILDHRTAPQEARRAELLAERERDGRPDDVRGLVEMLALPACELPYAAGATHYARFLEQVRNHQGLAQLELTPARWPTAQIAVSRLARQLTHLPPAVQATRLMSLMTVHFSLLADHERRWNGEGSPAPSAEEADELMTILVAVLMAPVREVAASR